MCRMSESVRFHKGIVFVDEHNAVFDIEKIPFSITTRKNPAWNIAIDHRTAIGS